MFGAAPDTDVASGTQPRRRPAAVQPPSREAIGKRYSSRFAYLHTAGVRDTERCCRARNSRLAYICPCWTV